MSAVSDIFERLRLAENEEDSTARALCATALLSTATAEGARQAKEGARPGEWRAHAKEGARPGGRRAQAKELRELSTAQTEGARRQQSLRNALLEGARPGGRRAQAKEVRELSTAQTEGARLQQSLRNALLADASRQKKELHEPAPLLSTAQAEEVRLQHQQSLRDALLADASRQKEKVMSRCWYKNQLIINIRLSRCVAQHRELHTKITCQLRRTFTRLGCRQ